MSYFNSDKMASNLRQKERVDYKSLNEGQFIKFNKIVPKSVTRVLDEDYFVERIIWRREDREKKVSTLFFQLHTFCLQYSMETNKIVY